ncbi:MAG TPA: hypothetical protein VJU61_01195, partial [Polyangiaceae bacterium]|nr:hypothetical protein [Polyangiaceae bacterium]
RGDGLRAAKHLLRAGERERGLDLLIETSAQSERLTDANMRAFFDTLRALPTDWLALYEEGLALCTELGRPARERDALLGRAAGFIAIANSAQGVDGVSLLGARLDRLACDAGLDLYAALPQDMDPAVRIRTALGQAQQRFDQTPPEQRVFEPMQAVQPLTTSMLSAIGVIAFTNDVAAYRKLPVLAPLAALSPALWGVHLTCEGVGARIQGRCERAKENYQQLLERLEQPDALGLAPTIQRTTTLRVSLSIGTLEACMGLAIASGRADLVASDPDYEPQSDMLRHLHHLWQGQLEQAQSLKHTIEQRRAFSATHNGYDGQHLLAELCAQVLLEDLTGLRHSAETAKRIAIQHPSWRGVAEWAEGEYERGRGDLHAALACVERALLSLGGPGEHQVWANAAAAHVRILVELQRHDEAVRVGEEYVRRAEQHDQGYLTNYIRVPLSHALCHTDLARATALAESVLASFRQLGSTGLNLVWALESCASVALFAGDTAAFDRYTALSSAENAQLSRRMRRARQWASTAREGSSAEATVSALVSELSSALKSCADVAEQGRQALVVLGRYAEARAGVFYARRGARLERVSSVGDLTHADELDRWAQAYFEGQLLAQEASTSQLDALGDVGSSQYGVPEGMYLPRLLGHESSHGYVYTGLLVLMMPVASDMLWMSAFTELLSRSLAAAGAA